MSYALITGASGGIGKEFAGVYAANGYDLVLVARNGQALEKLKAELEETYHRDIVLLPQDLTEPDAADALHAALNAREIYPEVLVNNAGFGDKADFVDSDWKRQANMVQLNILVLMKLTYLFGADMKARGHGKILNLSSIAAFSAGPRMSIYYASKAFVLSFSQSVNAELKPYGVTVTALCPGPTKTGFEKAAEMTNSLMFSLLPQTPQKVAQAGFAACEKGKAVRYHSPVTYAYNILTRLLPRSAGLHLAELIDGK